MPADLPLHQHTEAATTDQDPDVELFDFEAYRANGLLWALNRYVFHPRGLAVAWFYPEQDDGTTAEQPVGWQILRSSDGLWAFDEEGDHDGKDRFEAFLAYVDDRPNPGASA